MPYRSCKKRGEVRGKNRWERVFHAQEKKVSNWRVGIMGAISEKKGQTSRKTWGLSIFTTKWTPTWATERKKFDSKREFVDL